MAVGLEYASADFNSLRVRSVAVTPNDGADLATPMAVITCQVSGLIKFTDASGTDDTHYCNAGQALLVVVTRVWSTGTTATGISALYSS